ncbi:hypothetical protein EDB83DRAFT_181314 [Lactarius deliciosus]|nr:hypothetical protein EDB83DRAFT_181314 [Lactarius deliciosus]
MVRDTIFVDPFTFRKYFKNIGRAYREQATTLIEICRLYVDTRPQTYAENDGLQNVLRLADAALSAAGSAGKGTTAEATDAFVRVQEEIKQFGPPPLQKGTPGSHRKTLLDPSTALESASKKDKKSMSTLTRVKSAFKPPIPSGSIKKVNFVIVESLPYEERNDQLIMNQEIDNSTTAAEIVWRFSRYPEKGTDRIPTKVASRQNPHFYRHLSKDAASFDRNFHEDPLKDFAHSLDHGDRIYVLLDKSCRLFLDAAKPHIPRIFGNLWKPRETVILKDISGKLDSEDTVLRNIGKKQDYWHRPSITDSSQRRGYSGCDSEIVKKPVGNGRALVDAALRSQKVDLMIRDQSKPEPPRDSGWKPLPPEDPTTPRQSAPPLPQPEYSASEPSIGGSTVFTTSTESLGTTANMSDTSLPRAATRVGKRTEPVDSGIGRHMELAVPTADNSIASSSAPLAEPKIPHPSPADSQAISNYPLSSRRDINQKPLPSPGNIVRVQAPEDQITPRQSSQPPRRPEYSTLIASVPSFGGSTHDPRTCRFCRWIRVAR